MKYVLVTGASGFVGKNLCAHLSRRDDIKLLKFTRENTQQDLEEYVEKADFIYHLAGVNRPKTEKEFAAGNTDLTKKIVDLLKANKKQTPLLITSSIQAELDNPYGKSKLDAEEIVFDWAKESGNTAYVYRLPNVFGKWCKPNYNSVVATFCHNIAHDLPITINDPSHRLSLVYIDEVIEYFLAALEGRAKQNAQGFAEIPQTFEITLQELADKITAFHESRSTLVMPSLEDDFSKFIYATYTSYLETDNFNYRLSTNTDPRGWLAEFIKSDSFGQIFVSKTKPGISRGNHWHHTKIEKFLVVAGEGEISFRNVNDTKEDIIRYPVNGDEPTVLDIPAGYVHAIKNTGTEDMITVFWADEIFNKEKPDTYYEEV